MSEKLLLCAMLRRGAPGTAAEIVDDVNALVLAEGLPRSWLIKTVPKAFGILKAMRNRGLVSINGQRVENSREVPLWAPHAAAWDMHAPLPDAEEESADELREELREMDSEKLVTLFLALRMVITSQHRVVSAFANLCRDEFDQYQRTLDRAQQSLTNAGMAGKLGM